MNIPTWVLDPFTNADTAELLNLEEELLELTTNKDLKMDSVTYESLLTNTKAALGIDIKRDRNKSTFFNFFTTLLEDCGMCVNQGLGTVAELLLQPDLKLNILIEYISDAVCILHMLCNFIKNVVESVSMSCCSLKTFPTTTGQILINVFTHCKDSESIYGNNLVKVEKQLKDLFRSCHELQITYLMVLEKHFIFDLTKDVEQDVLIEALEINLKIGNIVQSLDVKTMAEQWKGFTIICEKHSIYLMDKNIYNECTNILCTMVRNNMKNALEVSIYQDDKVLVRSLKVTSFTIKILLKVTNIFKHAKVKNYDAIFELLIYIYKHSEQYLEWTGTKSLQFMNLIRSNILNPTDSLLKELFLDETFINSVFNCDVNAINKDDELFGYTVLLIAIMKLILQDPQKCNISKQKLLVRVFDTVSHSHVWFNMSIKFKTAINFDNQQHTCGLYEYILTHTTALLTTMNSEEISFTHNHMYKTLLSVDCYQSLFASNLWILLSRITNRQLNELVVLCRVFQKLETNVLFTNSPQQVHLSYTISRLYEIMPSEDKVRLYKQFSPVTGERNVSLWTTLRVENLPADLKYRIQEEVIDKCNQMLNVLSTGGIEGVSEMYSLINIMKLCSTCSISNDNSLKDGILSAWAKACPKHNGIILKETVDDGTIWYLKYIEALTYLTIAVKDSVLENSENLIKILHIIASIMETGYTEIKLLLIELLCIITVYPVHDANKHIECMSSDIFKCLLQDTDAVVKSTLFRILLKYIEYSKLIDIITSAINDNCSLLEIWRHFVEHGTLKTYNDNDLKQILMTVKDVKYIHRCIRYNENDTKVLSRESSKNFDFVDIDTLFNESDTEPECKKIKLDTNEIEDIISRLEMDASLLCKLKENLTDLEQIKRISNVCVKLQNITG
ncbi:FIGNL1-interacting regulator of recombination and mitosis [Aphomia sociella]